MTILDTIDNAISGWETSADAMRWTPEPSQALALPRIPSPTPEQVDAIGRQITAAMEPLANQLRQFADAAKRANLSIASLFGQMRQPQPQPIRAARLRQLRRDYRSKRRGW